MRSMTEDLELTVYGYMRDMLNVDSDYTFIIDIITAYTKQAFAKYFQERDGM